MQKLRLGANGRTSRIPKSSCKDFLRSSIEYEEVGSSGGLRAALTQLQKPEARLLSNSGGSSEPPRTGSRAWVRLQGKKAKMKEEQDYFFLFAKCIYTFLQTSCP